ncbi:MAG TPA: hypothetical protein ENI94_07405, partial [Gammaproteobacteria bacterium]|nr:hypothetical protein [Gammaproteobacteria bacterium]
MKYSKLYCSTVLTSLLILPAAHAAPIIIDGSLSDWGISVADGTAAQPVGTDYSGLRSDLAGSMI